MIATTTGPAVRLLAHRFGVAGQAEVVALVTYPGEAPRRVSFVGSRYGGPVVMVTADGTQTRVVDPGRFGDFGPAWVRRFYS